MVDIGLHFFAKMKSTQTTFIDDKHSKAQHFILNNTSHNKDMVFLGSSRTFYHIATNTFRKNNLNIYNLGISGSQFEDYPAFIPYLSRAKSKHIFLNLSVNRLYSSLRISTRPTLNEIKYYYHIDKIKFLRSLQQWVINRHLFLQYSEPIFYKIKSAYERFSSTHNHAQTNKQTPPTNNEMIINSSTNYSMLVGCKVFDQKQIKTTQIALKCTNGDGILMGNTAIEEQKEEIALTTPDKQSIQYIQSFIADLNTENMKISIILEPIFHNPYIYNLDTIKNQFDNIDIIDLTNFKIQNSFWADNGHLNYQGREMYSQHLSTILRTK